MCGERLVEDRGGRFGTLAQAGRGVQGGLTPSHQLDLPCVSTQLIHNQTAGAIQFVSDTEGPRVLGLPPANIL